jgi:phosphate transport system substrate-binding protein
MNILLALMFMCCSVEGRIQIRQTGSSTVYPFAIKIAQEFSKKIGHICPFVESTGTGSGFADFAQVHNGFGYDITNASRPINPKELVKCKESGMASILEVCIGHDGIAFAAKKNLTGFNALRLKDILTAVTKKITNSKGDIVDNPYHQWNEINSSLPNLPIRILIPSKSHGSRDAFEAMVMHGQEVRSGPELREINDYEAADGHHLLFDFLDNNPTTLAFVAVNLLDGHAEIKAMQIDGMEPTYSTIQNGTYPMVRKLFIYVRDSKTEGLQDYINEWLSPAAIGENGYLTKMGLIPLLDGVQKRRKL